MTSIVGKALSILAVGAMLWNVSVAAAADPARSFRFDIDNQTLGQALRSFGKVSRQEIIFSEDMVKNPKVVSLRGEFTIEDALNRLLEGTGLTARRSASGAIAIVKAGETAGVDEPADLMRLADSAAARASGSPAASESDEERKSQVVVRGDREKREPFSDANVDIPRTIDDAQPYYIFDSTTIERSAATSVEDFLKQRLTMNATALSNGQSAPSGVIAGGFMGNTSSIDLRGLGADKTLVLVNGRRIPQISVSGSTSQPDLNGIPLSSIDRIEVLPSSASGIYGGSALGGVVNVVLKRKYSGAELRANYDNTWDTDAPTRGLSLNFGRGFNDGRTQVTLAAAWTDSEPMRLEDRRELLDRGFEAIRARNPSLLYSNTTPFLGSTPNITNRTSAALVLKNDGPSLGSRFTSIAPGTTALTPESGLYSSLVERAGAYNFELPQSTQSPTGLRMPLGSTPTQRSLSASIRHQLSPAIEVFADAGYRENNTDSIYNVSNSFITVPSASPTSPFTTDVRVRAPDAADVPVQIESTNMTATLGAIARLPLGWTGEFDYTRSEGRFRTDSYTNDAAAMNAAILSGALNLFVDTIATPPDFARYRVPVSYRSESRLDDFSLRGSGPLFSLPWGDPRLTFGLQHRVETRPQTANITLYPLTPADDRLTNYFERATDVDSGYAELQAPLVREGARPMLHALELQASIRQERLELDTGTPSSTTMLSTGVVTYAQPTQDGRPDGDPIFSRASYTSTNHTIGLKYEPMEGVTLRASRATAFLPPLPWQLTPNPLPDGYSSTVTDPRTNTPATVTTTSGGNANLRPQNSRSLNAGIILEPRWAGLRGLRVNAEFYRIQQFDYITALGAQTLVDLEAVFPGRVTRDAAGGLTHVDNSQINVFGRETRGWDFTVSYRLSTGRGLFDFQAAQSIIQHLRNQYSTRSPQNDAVGFPSEGGAAKHKSNLVMTWEWRGWNAGWSARYFGSYKQYGAAGGPSADRFGGPQTTYLLPQGRDLIPSQTYHDVFVGYSFPRAAAGASAPRSGLAAQLLDGLVIQAGVRNVFDETPPMDVFYSGNFYTSPYGDNRLRSYWMTARINF